MGRNVADASAAANSTAEGVNRSQSAATDLARMASELNTLVAAFRL
ncbi:hypothetical protein [Actinoplanes sp. NPDC049118]